jgi:hypothetical protein
MTTTPCSGPSATLRPTIVAFLEAARCAGDVIASPVVGAKWDDPSALTAMTVGAVAGHVFLVLRRVDQHLDEPDGSLVERRPAATYAWLRVADPQDLDRLEHRTVRADGAHGARWGWEAVRDAFEQRTEKLAARLTGPCPKDVTLTSGVMDFEAYLATRIVELLVHADDLAVSVAAPFDLPENASAIAVETLVGAARSLHGDLEMVRSLTRRERVRQPGPTVF